MSREDKGSYPLISRVPKSRNAYGRHVYSTVGRSRYSHGSWNRRSRFLRYLRRLKRGRGINACVPSSNLTVVTDLRSSERISFVHLARGRVSWVPNHRKVLNSSTRCHFGISWVEVSGLASTRGLAPRYPRCRNSEISKSKNTILSRAGFFRLMS
jgi:hypothetical protein